MDYTVKPEGHKLREADNIVEGALEACKAVVSKEKSVIVSLGWTEDGFVKEEMGGVTGETLSSRKMNIRFNSTVSGWKKNLEATVAHEFAHTWFHEQNNTSWEGIQFNWQQVLMDSHAQHFAEKVVRNYSEPMSDAVSREEMSEKWSKIREVCNKELQEGRQLFYGGEEFETWTGYTAAYLIGEKLLESHELEEFPELKRSDVLEAGDTVFG
ncbi:MAG: DUF2268 domain-containing putative Zn-dependent protease [Candidatus Nanohalobium sp.]